MKIGILITGHIPEQLSDDFGNYGDMFESLLQDEDFTFAQYTVLENKFPNLGDCDGYIITGSKYGVYENLEWIQKLETFIRKCFNANIPIAGFCFGHQIMAQAMGGVVKKFPGGWDVGRKVYNLVSNLKKETISVMAWHQDQVIEKPKSSKLIASSDFCQIAGLVYGKTGLSLQSHPEYNSSFLKGLMCARGALLSKKEKSCFYENINLPLSTDRVTNLIKDFFKFHRPFNEGKNNG